MFFPAQFSAASPMQAGGFNVAPQLAMQLMGGGQQLQNQGIQNNWLPTNLATQNMTQRLQALAPYFTSHGLTPTNAMMVSSQKYRDNFSNFLRNSMQLGGAGQYGVPAFNGLNSIDQAWRNMMTGGASQGGSPGAGWQQMRTASGQMVWARPHHLANGEIQYETIPVNGGTSSPAAAAPQSAPPLNPQQQAVQGAMYGL